MSDDRYIGVFDSGIGGLTVLKEITSLLPDENILYLGDTARVPYGSKPKPVITEYALQAAKFFERSDIKVLVVACNTVSAVAISDMAKTVNFPIIGTVQASARVAVQVTKNKRVGVIGTRATIFSGTYEKILQRLDAEVEVFSKACPPFVSLVERGWIDNRFTNSVIKRYLSELKKRGIDTLVLGCTHYPLLIPAIARFMGEKTTLVNGAPAVADDLKRLLVEKNMLRAGTKGRVNLCLTLLSNISNKLIARILPEAAINSIKHVRLVEKTDQRVSWTLCDM